MSSLDSNTHISTLLESLDSETYDATNTVECYENGKTMACECGRGIGVEHDVMYFKCRVCGKVCYDTKYDEREAPEIDSAQSSLSDW